MISSANLFTIFVNKIFILTVNHLSLQRKFKTNKYHEQGNENLAIVSGDGKIEASAKYLATLNKGSNFELGLNGSDFVIKFENEEEILVKTLTKIIMLTYEFTFSSTTFVLNLLAQKESDNVSALLIMHQDEPFEYGIGECEADFMSGVVKIKEEDFRELWRYVLILVREYLGKDYLSR